MAYLAVRRKRRLSNPGRRRRKMSPKQIAIFGTKRQKAALRASRGRKRHRNVSIRKAKKRGHIQVGNDLYPRRSYGFARKRIKARSKRRKKNVGSILVATIPGMNPGRKRRKKKSMARRRRRARRNPGIRRRRHVRRHYSRRRRRNPGVRTRTVVRYRTRGRRHHRRGHRRNPGLSMGGDLSQVLGIVAGATVNSFAMGFVPAGFSTGIPGYIASAVIAVLQGQIVGKALRKPAFGKQMTIGGLTYTAIKVINDFFPTLSLGLHGLGAIAPSGGFFSPQVNRWGSMGLYQPPNTLLSAVAAGAAARGMKGLGDPNFSARRVGRIQ